jgi:hypothetical protein
MADLFVFPNESLKPVNYPNITNAEIIFVLTISIPIGSHPESEAPMDEKVRFLSTYTPLEFQKLYYMKTIDKALDILKHLLYTREDNVLFEIANKINNMYDVKELINKVKDVECTKDLKTLNVTLTEAKRYIYPDISLSRYASAQAKELGMKKYEYYAKLFQCYIETDKNIDMLTLFRISNLVFNFLRINNLSHIIKKMQFKDDNISRIAEKIKQRVKITLDAMADRKPVEPNEDILNSITIKIKEIDLG